MKLENILYMNIKILVVQLLITYYIHDTSVFVCINLFVL